MSNIKVEYWEQRYMAGETDWDLKSVTPAFLDILNDSILAGKEKLLVPGCGFGYDAVAAAKKGFDVTAVDISISAIDQAKKLVKERLKIKFIQQDFFLLDEINKFDIIYDYVTYCAIDPGRRKEYAGKVAALLNKEGIFIAIFFPVENRYFGPPFGVDIIEAENLFGEELELVVSTNKINSIKPRAGREHLQIFRKK